MEGLQVLSCIRGLFGDELRATAPLNLSRIRAFDELDQAVEQGQQLVEYAKLLNVDVTYGEMRLEVLQRLGFHAVRDCSCKFGRRCGCGRVCVVTGSPLLK